jgi:hypothetical protein
MNQALTIQSDLQTNLLKAAAETSTNAGRLLKFSKGHFLVGEDEIPAGREYVAHVSTMSRGWTKFVDNHPVDQRVGQISDPGFVLPKREELGDSDESKWERDATGKAKDPWTMQHYLPLEDAETGELLVFVTGSAGGRNAIGALCNVAARNVNRGAPIIKLGVDFYKHKSFGRIDVPALKVVSFANANGKKPTTGGDLNDSIPF